MAVRGEEHVDPERKRGEAGGDEFRVGSDRRIPHDITKRHAREIRIDDPATGFQQIAIRAEMSDAAFRRPRTLAVLNYQCAPSIKAARAHVPRRSKQHRDDEQGAQVSPHYSRLWENPPPCNPRHV